MPRKESVKKMKCPVCGKRACDLKNPSRGSVEVILKCPHCKNFVSIELADPTSSTPEVS